MNVQPEHFSEEIIHTMIRIAYKENNCKFHAGCSNCLLSKIQIAINPTEAVLLKLNPIKTVGAEFTLCMFIIRYINAYSKYDDWVYHDTPKYIREYVELYPMVFTAERRMEVLL